MVCDANLQLFAKVCKRFLQLFANVLRIFLQLFAKVCKRFLQLFAKVCKRFLQLFAKVLRCVLQLFAKVLRVFLQLFAQDGAVCVGMLGHYALLLDAACAPESLSRILLTMAAAIAIAMPATRHADACCSSVNNRSIRAASVVPTV